MASSLDPRSTCFNGAALKDLEAERQDRFIGVGIEAELTGNGFVVIALMEQSFAARPAVVPATAFERETDPQFSSALACLKHLAGAQESARR